MTGETPIISTESLMMQFSGLTAVDNVDLTVTDGDSMGLVGPNGAGKTTMFNLISGAFPPTAGAVYFKGTDVTDLDAEERAKMGMGRSFQISNLFSELTVLENLRLGLLSQEYDLRWLALHPIKSIDEYDEINREARELAELINLEEKINTEAKELSHGQKRSLELGITYSIDPDVLLLDEPTAGLAVDKTQNLTNILKKISSEKTIVIIEHNMDFLEKVINKVAVMNEGRLIAEGTLEEVRQDETVNEVYL